MTDSEQKGAERFIREKSDEWQAAIAAVFPKGTPQNATWHDCRAIAQTLNCFCGKSRNYTFVPCGGGMTLLSADAGKQPDSVELIPDPRGVYLCKVGQLSFEYFPEAPWESFLLLETAPQEPSGVDRTYNQTIEEATELPNGNLVDREFWDRGTYGRDEHGEDRPLPKGTRRAVRYLQGKFLMVAHFSWWNGALGLDDGRQDKLSATEIRAMIQAHLDKKTKGGKPS